MQRRPAGKHKGSRGKSQQANAGAGQVRIIGGRWRGSRLQVPDLPGLRPSGDRSRETLFNWLQPWLPGASCLDLFAGSGALGFEAASRGASRVVLMDSQAMAVRALEASRERLKATDINVIHTDAMSWIGHCKDSFDIVFVDPPFADELHQRSIELLLAHDLLNPGGWLYLEAPLGAGLPEASGLEIYREKQMGEAQMVLFRNAPK